MKIACGFMRTERQWAMEGYKPISTSAGNVYWTNQYCQHVACYFEPDEVTPMTEEEVEAFKEEERAKRRERDRKRRAKLKEIEYQCSIRSTIPGLEILCDGYLDLLTKISTIPKSKTIVLDTETTGLDCFKNEMLQLSIIDGNGKKLFNNYLKPEQIKRWPDAQKIHGISPAKVARKKPFSAHREKVQDIINHADLIITYNERFDLPFLKLGGITFPTDKYYYDVMETYAEYYGEWNSYFEDYKWQTLISAARHFGFDYTGEKAHDALTDVKATLHVYQKLTDKQRRLQRVDCFSDE